MYTFRLKKNIYIYTFYLCSIWIYVGEYVVECNIYVGEYNIDLMHIDTNVSTSFSICSCGQEIHAIYHLQHILWHPHDIHLKKVSHWKKNAESSFFSQGATQALTLTQGSRRKKISPRSPEIVFDLTLVPKLQHNGRLGGRAIFRTKFSKSSKQLSGNFLKGGFLKRCHFNKMFQREREP